MQPVDDLPLGPGHGPSVPPSPSKRASARWVPIVLMLCLIVAAAAALYLTRSSGDESVGVGPAASATRKEVPTARGPLGPPVEPRELPPLDLTDPLVRELLRGLSSRPELAAWLATDGLIRNIVASVDAVANGTTPSAHLRRLTPAGSFSAAPRGEDFVIDPRSYRRYDGIADTVSALDAEGLARAYSTLRPRLQEAYKELGYPDGNFDVAVERAIIRLLETPLVDRDLDVRPAPVLYQFADSRLERLAPAQKQLLRMGPRNGRLIQAKLRELAGALQIPAERLP